MDNLPIETQFNIRAFESQVDEMNLEEAKIKLKEIYRQMIKKETMYQNHLKQKWGLESNSNPH